MWEMYIPVAEGCACLFLILYLSSLTGDFCAAALLLLVSSLLCLISTFDLVILSVLSINVG